jgi:GNAT superfamily N-acetyltransferase
MAEGEVLIREAATVADDERAAGLMVDYLTWAHERLAREYGVEEPPIDPLNVRDGFASFRPPDGCLLLAECGGDAVGVGALRMLRPAVAEVKRMYVRPKWRGRRLGSALLDRLLSEAADRHAVTVLLDTCRFMTDAQGLYRSRGFTERPPYEGTEIPERIRQHWIFFERHAA